MSNTVVNTKRHWPMMILGLFVFVIFILSTLLFMVKEEEIALRLKFGKPQKTADGQLVICDSGLHFKLPYPMEDIWRIDARVRNYELGVAQIEQTPTKDGSQLLLTNFVCWRIDRDNADRFMVSVGNVKDAEKVINDLMRDARGTIIPQYKMSEIINKDPSQLKRVEMEGKILSQMRSKAIEYGIQIVYVGFKHTGFPDEVRKSVFDKMASDRKKISEEKRFAGESEAKKIRSNAEAEAASIRIEGERKATELQAEGMIEATKYLEIYAQNQELAIFLRKLEALKSSVGNNSVLFFDATMPPFDLLQTQKIFLNVDKKENKDKQ